MRDELAATKAALADAITGADDARARLKLPRPAPDMPMDLQADFTPYRRYYLAQQRHMANSIGPLRIRAREMLMTGPAQLRQLAEIDAALDQALGNREGELLATIPALLESHFARLWQAHQAVRADAETEDDPAQWLLPDGWLTRFRGDLQDVLHAELEFRLQPVIGLIEAYGNDSAMR